MNGPDCVISRGMGPGELSALQNTARGAGNLATRPAPHWSPPLPFHPFRRMRSVAMALADRCNPRLSQQIFLRGEKLRLRAGPARRCLALISGAGEGNRTLVVSLGSFCSTIELHPRPACDIQSRRPGQAGSRRNAAAPRLLPCKNIPAGGSGASAPDGVKAAPSRPVRGPALPAAGPRWRGRGAGRGARRRRAGSASPGRDGGARRPPAPAAGRAPARSG